MCTSPGPTCSRRAPRCRINPCRSKLSLMRDCTSGAACGWPATSSMGLPSPILHEPEVEREEHQHDPDVDRQPLPGLVPEEQQVDANDDDDHREHVESYPSLSSHGSILLRSAVDEQFRRASRGGDARRNPGCGCAAEPGVT